jgi:hypothetical protein
MAQDTTVLLQPNAASTEPKRIRPRSAELRLPQDSRLRRLKDRGRPRFPQDDYHNYCRYSGNFSNVPSPNDQIPPILRLPTEIRREIIRYLIPGPSHKFRLYTDADSMIVGSKPGRNKRPKHKRDHLRLAILRANKQLYSEALSVLYSENLFHFIGFNYLPVLEFIRRLSPDARDLVRQVRLTLLTDPKGKHNGNHDLLCKVIHDYLPFLTTMRVDPVFWI